MSGEIVACHKARCGVPLRRLWSIGTLNQILESTDSSICQGGCLSRATQDGLMRFAAA